MTVDSRKKELYVEDKSSLRSNGLFLPVDTVEMDAINNYFRYHLMEF